MTDVNYKDQHDRVTEADSRLIKWLLFESGVSRYSISRAVDISESTLSRIVSGETALDQMRFGYAQRLTAYARKIQHENNKNNKKNQQK